MRNDDSRRLFTWRLGLQVKPYGTGHFIACSSGQVLPSNVSANFDVLVMIGASLLLFVSLFLGKKGRLDRWQGLVYILFYIVYIISFIVRA